MITREEAGDYIGYTKGDALPTYYFSKGRLTQIHNNAENVGWHPLKPGAEHTAYNISEELAAQMASMWREVHRNADKTKAKHGENYLKGRTAYLNGLLKDFKAGVFKGNDGAGTKLFELTTGTDGTFKSIHPSRSVFVPKKPNDPNEPLAYKALANAKLAQNEMNKKK